MAYYTDQMIVKYKPVTATGINKSMPESKTILATQSGMLLTSKRDMSGHAKVYRIAGGAAHIDQVREAARQLMADNPDIEYAEPDYRKFPMGVFVGTPNDTYYSSMWNLKDPASQTVSPWGGAQGGGGANLPGAWAAIIGDPSLVVAVLDTGILAGHEDLVGRTVPGYDFLSSPVTANDGDGRDANPADPGDCTDAALAAAAMAHTWPERLARHRTMAWGLPASTGRPSCSPCGCLASGVGRTRTLPTPSVGQPACLHRTGSRPGPRAQPNTGSGAQPGVWAGRVPVA